MSAWLLNWARSGWWWRPLVFALAAALMAAAVRHGTVEGARALAAATGSLGAQRAWTLLIQALLLAALAAWLGRREGAAAWAYLTAVTAWVALALLGQQHLSYLVLAAAVLLLHRRRRARLPALLGICTASWLCADTTALAWELTR
ncbi:hypothetical protein ACWCYY_11545 [Kitasatospora sp. NPDC001664]